MGVFEIWELIKDFLQMIAPVVITFVVCYIGTLMIKGYITVLAMLKFIFASSGRIAFIVILYLVVMYFWESLQATLGW